MVETAPAMSLEHCTAAAGASPPPLKRQRDEGNEAPTVDGSANAMKVVATAGGELESALRLLGRTCFPAASSLFYRARHAVVKKKRDAIG